MMSINVYMFPGQGSQEKGMGAGLFDKFPELVRTADEILGYSIKQLCLEDPDKKLNQTQYTQPAIYVVNALSYFNKREESSETPDFLLGHSLGEFNALMAAECFDFATGLKLVQKRGELMSQAVGGGMAAVLGASEQTIRDILKDNGLTRIDLANFNSPSQIVISGAKDDIIKAADCFNIDKIRFVPLNTSGAFHSRLMQTSMQEFEVYLKNFSLSEPKIPVISNVTGRPYENDRLFTNLVQQISSLVRWASSIQYLMAKGDVVFNELGHGTVLMDLVTRIKFETSESDLQNIRKASDTSSDMVSWLEQVETFSPLQKVEQWNNQFDIGQKVKSTLLGVESETRTRAQLLFKHRAAIYLQDYNGYFELDEVSPI